MQKILANQMGERANPMAPGGIVCTIIGTAVAILIIPIQHFAPGALFPSALALTLGLLLPICWNAFKRPRDLFRSDHLLLVGIVYWILLDLLQGVNDPRGVSRTAIQLAFLAVGLFAIGIWIGVLFKPWRMPGSLIEAGQAKLSSSLVFGSVIVCFSLCFANYFIAANFDVLEVFKSIGKPRFSEAWAASQLGGWTAFREHLIYFGYLVPSLTVLLAKQVGWFEERTMMGVVFSLTCLAFSSQTGCRGELGVVAGAALLCWLLLKPQITFAVLIKLGLTLVVMFGWMQLMLLYRNEGLGMAMSESANGLATRSLSMHLAVDDNFLRLCQVMDLMPSRIEHSFGGQMFYVLVRPIPRVLWSGKPVGPGFGFEEAVGVNQATLSVSAIGEFYFDFGLPFVLFGGFVYGRLAGMWNRFLYQRRGSVWPMLYAIGAMALFMGVRSQQAFLTRAYPVLFWVVIYNLFFLPGADHLQARPAVARSR